MHRRVHWFFKFLLVCLTLTALYLLFAELIPRVFPTVSLSDTSVSGIQLRSEQWSGTIHVVGDVITPHGVAITVLPGTRIIVNHDSDSSNLDFLPWHLRVGLNQGKEFFGVQNGEYFWDEGHRIHIYFSKLIALGTKQQPIVITSDSPADQASPYDINSITVGQGVLANVEASNYRKLEIGDKVTVRDSKFDNSVECSICIGNSDPSVLSNSFKRAIREDIWIGGGSPRIISNYFASDPPVGIRLDPEEFGEPVISHNDFEMPLKLAIDDLTGDEAVGGQISYNTFAGNSVIKIPCDTKMKIFQNSILGMITFSSGGCAQTLTLEPNYWGITDRKRILNERILRKDQNLLLLIPAVLDNPPNR